MRKKKPSPAPAQAPAPTQQPILDERARALAAIEMELEAVESAREPEVIVYPEGSTSDKWNVVLVPDRQVRDARRRMIVQRLLALPTWALVLVYSDTSHTSPPDRMRWPEPPSESPRAPGQPPGTLRLSPEPIEGELTPPIDD